VKRLKTFGLLDKFYLSRKKSNQDSRQLKESEMSRKKSNQDSRQLEKAQGVQKEE
jgi:hypothetical protein